MIWAIQWRSRNALDGLQQHIIYEDCLPALFLTRQKCRNYINVHWGYIRERPDLRHEPFGWMMPVPIKVKIVLNEANT